MRKEKDHGALLLEIYNRLLTSFGHQHWWPGSTPFEVMIGAILTQNTAWSNVERAITNLKEAGLLEPKALMAADVRKLRRLIRPSGYFNEKAKKLKAFLEFFLSGPYRGSIAAMKKADPEILRGQLLSVWGIGPETADSILCYALGHQVFVVDAYTRRSFARLGLVPEGADYHEVQRFFVQHLPRDTALYNDFHAQIVNLGKDYCRPRPRCEDCPLSRLDRCRI